MKKKKQSSKRLAKGPSLAWQVNQLTEELEDLREKVSDNHYAIENIRNSMVYISRLPGQYSDIEKALVEIRGLIQNE